MERLLIVTTCGTSLLSNCAEEHIKPLVFKYANARRPEDVPDVHRIELKELSLNASSMLESAGPGEAKRLSAELNALMAIYGAQPAGMADVHLLIGTDTWLGNIALSLIEQWLKSFDPSFIVIPLQVSGLQTADHVAFQEAASELAKNMEEILPGYKDSGYKVLFNLTGGFKAILAMLNSLAPLYADEVVYIFETSKEPIHIPRLPMSLDENVVIGNIEALRRLRLGLPVKKKAVKDVPESLLFRLDGDVTLSAWGKAFVERCLDRIYRQRLWPAPSRKIRFSEQFRKDVRELSRDRIKIINQRMDDLARFLEKGENISSLSFKQLKGDPVSGATHEFYAWSDQDAKRCFGRFDGKVFDILCLGDHL